MYVFVSRRCRIAVGSMPDLEVAAALNKLSGKIDNPAAKTRQIVANLAERQDSIEESIQALTAEIKSGDGPPCKKTQREMDSQQDADMTPVGFHSASACSSRDARRTYRRLVVRAPPRRSGRRRQ